MIHGQMPAEDPIHAAIARHRAAYDAFQVAPEGTPSVEASNEYDAASDALVSTACATRFGALALLTHLRWWLADEAEFQGWASARLRSCRGPRRRPDAVPWHAPVASHAAQRRCLGGLPAAGRACWVPRPGTAGL